MKTILSYLAVFALIITSSFTVNQQEQLNNQPAASCFGNFRLHKQGKAGIVLSWTVSSTEIVQFEIERSYDGEFFENVNAVDFDGSSAYKYKDTDIYPGLIYYRIKAVLSDGTEEYSPVESVRIVQRG